MFFRFPKMGHNVPLLADCGDSEAIHFQPNRNFDRSKKLNLTTVPPILGRCC